jgi:hypothetical protein
VILSGERLDEGTGRVAVIDVIEEIAVLVVRSK